MFALSFQLGHIHAFRHRNSTVDEQLRMRESNSAEVALHSTAVSEFVLQRGEMPHKHRNRSTHPNTHIAQSQHR